MAISKTQPMRQAEIALIDDYNENIGLLVKDVSDNANDIDTLETTVGDNSSGLVKAVSDNSDDISALETTVGDNSSGLVYSVNNLDLNVTDLQNNVTQLINCAFDVSSTSGSNTKNFTMEGNAAFIILSRGTTSCIALINYWDSTITTLGNATNVTFSKEANSRNFTVTVTVETGAKGCLISNNIKEVI